MATSELQNPADPGTVGRREASKTRTENGNERHWPRFLPEEPRDRGSTGGIYFFHSGAMTVQASAHGAGAGFFWLINPVGSTELIALRRARMMSQHNTALATPTGPRIVLERFTFTGTASGATVTSCKNRSANTGPTCSVRTANTGMTQTPVAIAIGFMPVVALTAVGGCPPGFDTWIPNFYEDQIILAAGEGLRCYQADGGTASDTRRFFVDMAVDEFLDMG